MSNGNSRLPNYVRPELYVIELTLDLTDKAFSGKETVTGKILEKCKVISFNAKCLDITSISFDFGKGAVAPFIKYDVNNECLSAEFESDVEKGDFSIALEFSGKIVNNGLYGLYSSLDSVGNEIVVSHFQTGFARCVFPCWDEPSFKSEFRLQVTCPNGYHCLSNMPSCEEVTIDSQKLFTFEKTPAMSSYLLGLVVGKFDVITAATNNGVNVSVYTPKGKSSYGNYGLETATAIVPFFEEFFKVPFMLPKLDLVSVPEHTFVAMENWGLLVFREANLLLNKDAAEARKVDVCQLIGHEIAHQWFGNLVTCEWWSDIWLNEGFAEWTEYLTVSKLFPKRKPWLDFLHIELAEALAVDGLATAHPLGVAVDTPTQTAEIFDSITYAKGCSLVRMVYNFIGEQNFRDGLELYLTKFAYKNATTADLWAAFDSVCDMGISKVMHAYVSQAGYPFIDISFPKDKSLSVKVETFSSHGRQLNSKREAIISLKLTHKDSGKVRTLSGFSTDGMLNFEDPDIAQSLIIANAGSIARVSYPMTEWRKLGLSVKSSSLLSSEERFCIQSDLFAFAVGRYPGGYSAAKWLAFVTNYVDSEMSFAVWKDIISELSLISGISFEHEFSSSFKYFVKKLLSPRLSALTWEKQAGEDPEHAQLRALLITALGFFDDERVMSEAQCRFAKHISREALIDPELQSAIFCVVAFHGGKKEFKDLFQLFDEAPTDDLRSQILSAVGCFQEPETRTCLLNWLDQENLPISIQSLPRVLNSMALSPDGQQAALEYVIRNWTRFVVMCAGPSGLLFGRIINAAALHLTDVEVADLIEVTFDNEPLPTAKKSIEQLCDIIRVQAKWASEDADNLCEFFKKFCDPDYHTFSHLFDFYFPSSD